MPHSMKKSPKEVKLSPSFYRVKRPKKLLRVLFAGLLQSGL